MKNKILSILSVFVLAGTVTMTFATSASAYTAKEYNGKTVTCPGKELVVQQNQQGSIPVIVQLYHADGTTSAYLGNDWSYGCGAKARIVTAGAQHCNSSSGVIYDWAASGTSWSTNKTYTLSTSHKYAQIVTVCYLT